MKLIELHILQSFPVSCLNRDDVGAPKSAFFGGVNRARISSQCLKRAIRELAKETTLNFFNGERSRLIVEPLAKAIQENGVDVSKSLDFAKLAADQLSTFDKENEKKGKLQVKTLTFLSPLEIDAIGKEIADIIKAGGSDKNLMKAIIKSIKSVQLKDAADIAIFGRMVASDHTLTVEGAGMFSHALSVNKVDSDIDFFAAVDDLQKKEESGAGMTGVLEFNSACYYRYAALNLDLFKNHLQVLTADERKKVIATFIRSCLIAVPGARKNSMNANTLPSHVLGIVKDGQPIQLINAFENPVRTERNKSLSKTAEEVLIAHKNGLEKTWGLTNVWQGEIPKKTLDEFCKELLNYVE